MKPLSLPSAMLWASARACWNLVVSLSKRIGNLAGENTVGNAVLRLKNKSRMPALPGEGKLRAKLPRVPVAQSPPRALCCVDGSPAVEGGAPTLMRTFLAACRARWKQLAPLSRDVTLVFVFKASALGILWALFFSA